MMDDKDKNYEEDLLINDKIFDKDNDINDKEKFRRRLIEKLENFE